MLKLTGVSAVAYETSNPDVAVVDAKGCITAKSEGRAVITALGKDGYSYQCSVTVENPKLMNLEIIKGRTAAAPLMYNSQKVAWKVSSTAVTINKKTGVLTAKSVGKSKLTAQLASGKVLTAEITVVPGLSTDRLLITTGDAKQVVLQGAKIAEVESKFPEVVSVSSKKNVWTLRGLSKGTSRVTVTDTSERKYLLDVTVEAPGIFNDLDLTTPISELTMHQNGMQQLNVLNTNQTYTWKSSRTSVVKVSANGMLTAKAVGTAKVTAKLASGKILELQVKVLPILKRDNVTLCVDNTATLALTKGSVVFASADSDVVAVTKKGKVTAKAPGEANVTVKDVAGNSYVCHVTVENPSLNISELEMGQGRTQLIEVLDSQQTVKWSAKGSVSVNRDGLITAKKIGSGTITATLTSGKRLTAAVKVRPTVSVDSLSVAMGDKVPSVKLLGTTLKKCYSTNENVAVISTKGVVTVKGTGEADLVFVGKNSTEYICHLRVENPRAEQTDVVVYTGRMETLTLVDNTQTVTWTSSNKKVAVVNSSGNVSGIKTGTAVIKAKVASGRTITFNVTVKKKPVYTLTFDSLGGSTVASQTVVDGNSPEEPHNPVKEGYVFTGWYADENAQEPFFFSSRLRENTIVYAGWIEESGGADGVITRGNWILKLADLVGMNLEDQTLEGRDNHYADSEGSEYGVAVETAYAYGLLPEESLEDANQDVPMFRPENLAEREFVAYTIAKALGATQTPRIACADQVEITHIAEVSYVVNSDIIRLKNNRFMPKAYLTEDDMAVAEAGISKIIGQTSITYEYNNFTYAAGALVKQFENVTDYQFIRDGDNFTLTMALSPAAKQVRKGNVIVMPATEIYKTGALLKVVSSMVSGDDIIFRGVKPSFEEVFTSFEFAGTTMPAEFVSAEAVAGFEVEYIPAESVEFPEDGMLTGATDEDTAGFLKQVGGTFPILGKLKFSTDAVEIVGGKLKGSVEIEIPQVTCLADINVGLKGVDVNSFIFSMSSKIKISCDMKYTLTEAGEYSGLESNRRFIACRKEIGCTSFALPYGFSLDFQWFINYSVNGTISISYTIDSTLGMAYNGDSFRLIHDFRDSLNILDLKGSASLTIGVAPAVGYASIIEIVGFTVEIGPAFEIKFTTLVCGDGEVYLMAKLALDKQTVVGHALDKMKKLLNASYTLEYKLLDNKSSNPLRKKFHLEYFQLVPECTFGTSKLTGSVVSDATGHPISGAQVEVRDEHGAVVRTLMTNGVGIYSTDNLDSGEYELVIRANNYKCVTLTVVIASGHNCYAPEARLVTRTNLTGVLQISAIDAMTDEKVADYHYTIHPNWDNPDGPVVAAGDTTEKASVELEAGNYTVVLTKEGYSRSVNKCTISPNNIAEYKYIISPTINDDSRSGTMRIVLTWGEYPRDLDSHLVGPGERGKFHVYYSNKTYAAGTQFAQLDVDHTNGNGPESTIVTGIKNGLYSYSVHNYSNRYDGMSSDSLAKSGATVQVYIDSNLVRTFHVPVDKYGTVWHVFDYDPITGSIIPSNEFLIVSSPEEVGYYAMGDCSNMDFLMSELREMEEKYSQDDASAEIEDEPIEEERTEEVTEESVEDFLEEESTAEETVEKEVAAEEFAETESVQAKVIEFESIPAVPEELAS